MIHANPYESHVANGDATFRDAALRLRRCALGVGIALAVPGALIALPGLLLMLLASVASILEFDSNRLSISASWLVYFGLHLLLLVLFIEPTDTRIQSARFLSTGLAMASIFVMALLLTPERRFPLECGLAVVPELFMIGLFGCNTIAFSAIRLFLSAHESNVASGASDGG